MVVSLNLAHIYQTFALSKLYAVVQETSFIKKLVLMKNVRLWKNDLHLSIYVYLTAQIQSSRQEHFPAPPLYKHKHEPKLGLQT